MILHAKISALELMILELISSLFKHLDIWTRHTVENLALGLEQG